MELIGFVVGLDVGCEENGKVDDVIKAFGLSNWKDGVGIYRDEESCGKSKGLGKE